LRRTLIGLNARACEKAPRPVSTLPIEVAVREPCVVVEFGHRLALRRQPRRGHPPVPVAGDNAPAIAREFVGKVWA